jgi:hypothetical protein
MTLLRRHEQLLLLWALAITTVWPVTLVWLPGSWWGVPVASAASYALSWLVLRLIP